VGETASKPPERRWIPILGHNSTRTCWKYSIDRKRRRMRSCYTDEEQRSCGFYDELMKHGPKLLSTCLYWIVTWMRKDKKKFQMDGEWVTLYALSRNISIDCKRNKILNKWISSGFLPGRYCAEINYLSEEKVSKSLYPRNFHRPLKSLWSHIKLYNSMDKLTVNPEII